jgi:hypothetical protein
MYKKCGKLELHLSGRKMDYVSPKLLHPTMHPPLCKK